MNAEDFAKQYYQLDKSGIESVRIKSAVQFAQRFSYYQLLSFCHFIGNEGYKINGYDDSQLEKVIEQFLNMQSAPSAQ
jgi:hypothetical protein